MSVVTPGAYTLVVDLAALSRAITDCDLKDEERRTALEFRRAVLILASQLRKARALERERCACIAETLGAHEIALAIRALMASLSSSDASGVSS